MESRQSAFGFPSPLRQQPFPSLPLSPQTTSGSVFWVLPLMVFYSSEKIKRFFLVKAFPRWYPGGVPNLRPEKGWSLPMRRIWYFQNDPDLPDEINLDDNSLPNPGTIVGEDFRRLMDLCFSQADVFSLTKVHGPYRTDVRLEPGPAEIPDQAPVCGPLVLLCPVRLPSRCHPVPRLPEGKGDPFCGMQTTCFWRPAATKTAALWRICVSFGIRSCFSGPCPMSSCVTLTFSHRSSARS